MLRWWKPRRVVRGVGGPRSKESRAPMRPGRRPIEGGDPTSAAMHICEWMLGTGPVCKQG